MEAFRSSFIELQNSFQGFLFVLEYAACELFLNFLLLIYALFSYLLTKFARQCKLQLPCILCSRLDHMLGNEKPGFYCNLLCTGHRSEMSSLFSSCIHGVDRVNGSRVCEECFLPSAKKSRSNSEQDRPEMCKFQQSSLPEKDLVPGIMGMRMCSCRNKPWRLRQNADKLTMKKPPRGGTNMPNIRLTRREGLKKVRERFSESAASRHLRKFSFDPLSHVGYKELKIISDSDSEFPFSDEDEGCITRRMKEPKEVPPVTLTNLFHFDANIDHDRGQKTGWKICPSAPPELISVEDFPVLPNGVESTEKCERKSQISQTPNHSELSELISLVEAPSLFNVVKGPLESSRWKSDGAITSNTISMHDEIRKSVTRMAGAGSDVDQAANAGLPLDPTYMNKLDVMEPAIIKRETRATAKEPERLEATTDLFPSENTLYQGPGIGPDDGVSSADQGRGAELQAIDPSSSNGAHSVQETTSMESGLESYDGSSVSEIEGEVESENVVDRLKRQIERDQKCINALCKELEEERNASAIAANQAMAMITRLQEEKAAIHMESLQYLRMMEEQAEHDVEALERANDLLAEREKEIQDMEAEIEYFSIQLLDKQGGRYPTLDDGNRFCVNDEGTVPCSLNNKENPINIMSSWAELEDEKLYIKQCLSDLERKLCPSIDVDVDSGETADKGINKEESHSHETAETHETGNTSVDGDPVAGKENTHSVSSKQDREVDLVNLENEISDLNERLEALECGWNLIEHSVSSLRAGNEGLQFVQEVAHQLQKLQKTVTRTRSQ